MRNSWKNLRMRLASTAGLKIAQRTTVMLLLIIAIAAAVVTAFVSLDWFFASAEETDESMRESQRWFQPWWGTKFGIWIALSGFVGHATYFLLPYFFPKWFVPL
jgi:hypothetical protein